MSEEEIRDVVSHMRECGIPCDAIIWVSIIWITTRYLPGHQIRNVTGSGKDDRRSGEGRHQDLTCIDPGVKLEEGYSVYDKGVENGYFATTPEGEIYVNAVWPGDAVYPDFGKKEVRDWWGENQQFLVDKGVRGVWKIRMSRQASAGSSAGRCVYR